MAVLYSYKKLVIFMHRHFHDLFQLYESSWKRSHITTGSTPNKPSEKRQRNGNRGARKPLDFSAENVQNPEQTVNVKSPFRDPRYKVTVQDFLS